MKKLFTVIDETLLENRDEQSRWSEEHRKENGFWLKIDVLRKFEKKEEADALVQQSIVYPGIRESYLNDLFLAKKFNEAKKVAHEGISIARKNKHYGNGT